MYLLELSLYEFKQFIQIVLWVSLPLIVICLTAATFLHYRRKRKKKQIEPDDEAIMYDMPAAGAVQPMLSPHTRTPGTEALLKQYEQQLLQSKDKYHTLEKSFRILQENYSAVISRFDDDDSIDKSEWQILQEKIEGYELKIAQLEQALSYIKDNSDTTAISSAASIENKREEVEQLEKLITRLTEDLTARTNETNHLRDELDLTVKDKDLLYLKEKISGVEEENLALKNTFPEVKYLEDLVKEKNLQVDFLQQQLEQRIKHNHHLEHQQNILNDTNAVMQDMLMKTALQSADLEQQIHSKQNEMEALQGQLNELLNKNEQLENALQISRQEMVSVTNELTGMQNNQSGLQESLADKITRIRVLEEELAVSRHAAIAFEAKWENTSQLISRIYRELSGSVDDQMIVSSTGAIINAGKQEPHSETLV